MSRAEARITALEKASAPATGLRERVGFALAALLLTTSVTLSLGLAAYARSVFLDNAGRELDGLARQTARELSYGMERFVREIELQAHNPVFAEWTADPVRMRQALEEIQRVHPEFAHISVVDVKTATVIAATGGIYEGGNGRGRPVFEEGQKRLFVADVHDAVKLAEVLPKPANGEPLRFLDAAAPVRAPDGKVIRVLGSHLSWEWTSSIRKRVMDPIGAGRGVQMMLVDTAGKVVLPPDSSVKVGAAFAALAGATSAPGQRLWSDGKEYVAAEAPTFASGSFPGLGWRVVARQPLEVAVGAANRLRDLLLAAGALLGILAASLGWVVAGRLVKPVSDLARDAEAASVGKRLTLNGSREVAEVAAVRQAFDRVTGESLRRAERLLSELNALYQGAPVALCVVDSELRYVRVNQVWADAFELELSEDSKSTLTAHAPSTLIDALRAALAGSKPVTIEIEAQTTAGLRAWQTVLAPLHGVGGVAAGAGIVATDVTENRRAERELREADERKNQFVSMLAHELRNPLAPIANAIEVLGRSPSEEQVARMREAMRKQVRRMARLIDDLLDISRVTHGKVNMRMEALSIREVCESACDMVRPQVEAKCQHLEVTIEEGLPFVRGDRVRLEQVVCNLLSNSSKYGRDGGNIRLRVTREGALAHVVVEDDGQGISPDFLPHVFDLFAQGHVSVDRHDGGLGIGLTLVKNLVELHGGDVAAESEGLGRGARITVRLPIEGGELSPPTSLAGSVTSHLQAAK